MLSSAGHFFSPPKRTSALQDAETVFFFVSTRIHLLAWVTTLKVPCGLHVVMSEDPTALAGCE